MTDRTTTYDPTKSREPRSSSLTGVGGGTGATGYGDDFDAASEKDRARRAAEEIKTAAKEAAASTAGAVRSRLSGELDYRKYRSRQRLGRVATALRDAASNVSEDEMVARTMERAAERVETLAGYLDQKDVGEILHDAREMARRRPEIFVGSLFVAGLMLGRFLRSSTPNGKSGNGHGHGDYSGGSSAGWSAGSSPSTPTGGLVP